MKSTKGWCKKFVYAKIYLFFTIDYSKIMVGEESHPTACQKKLNKSKTNEMQDSTPLHSPLKIKTKEKKIIKNIKKNNQEKKKTPQKMLHDNIEGGREGESNLWVEIEQWRKWGSGL